MRCIVTAQERIRRGHCRRSRTTCAAEEEQVQYSIICKPTTLFYRVGCGGRPAGMEERHASRRGKRPWPRCNSYEARAPSLTDSPNIFGIAVATPLSSRCNLPPSPLPPQLHPPSHCLLVPSTSDLILAVCLSEFTFTLDCARALCLSPSVCRLFVLQIYVFHPSTTMLSCVPLCFPRVSLSSLLTRCPLWTLMPVARSLPLYFSRDPISPLQHIRGC